MIAHMRPETENSPEILPADSGEDMIGYGIEDDPLLQVVTHVMAGRYAQPVMREILDPLYMEIHKLAEGAGDTGKAISRRLGAIEDVTVSLAYVAIPDIVTIIAAGAISTHLSLDEMMEESLRAAGWTRASLEAQLQRRFGSEAMFHKLNELIPGFTIDRLRFHERSTDPDCITAAYQAVKWADTFILARLERQIPADHADHLQKETESYHERCPTLPLKFEEVATAVLSDVLTADADGHDLTERFEDLGGSSGLSDEVAHRAKISETLSALAEAMRLHEMFNNIGAMEVVRSRINPKP